MGRRCGESSSSLTQKQWPSIRSLQHDDDDDDDGIHVDFPETDNAVAALPHAAVGANALPVPARLPAPTRLPPPSAASTSAAAARARAASAASAARRARAECGGGSASSHLPARQFVCGAEQVWTPVSGVLAAQRRFLAMQEAKEVVMTPRQEALQSQRHFIRNLKEQASPDSRSPSPRRTPRAASPATSSSRWWCCRPAGRCWRSWGTSPAGWGTGCKGSSKEARNTPFSLSQEKFHPVVIRDVRNISEAASNPRMKFLL